MKWLKSSNNYGLNPETGCVLQCRIYEPTNPELHTTLFFKLIVLYFSWTIFASIIIYNIAIILKLLLKTNTFIDFLKLTGGKPLLKKVQARAKQNKTKPTVPPNQTNKPKKTPTHYIKKTQPPKKKKKKSHLTQSQLCKEESILFP